MQAMRMWSRLAALGALSVVLTAVGIGASAERASAADIHSCEFGTGQVFDVQWGIDNSTLSVSSMAYPYSNYGMFYPTAPATRFDSSTLASTDYFQFFDSTTVPGTLGLEVFSGDGTLRGVIDDTGSFQALGNGFIFYVGDGSWGTLFTTQTGFHYGDSAEFTATNTAPTTADALAFTSCATVPVTLPVITSGNPPAGTVGKPYSFTVPASGSGFTYAVTGGSLPAGLRLDPATGKISGTPTAPGSSTLTITVTGGTGAADASYTITIGTAATTGTGTGSQLATTGVDVQTPGMAAVAVILVGGILLVRRRRARTRTR
jgi:hypothetical protein